MTRRVIVIPIVHTSADLGTLSEPVKARHAEQFGPDQWTRREQAVERLWEEIRRRLKARDLDYRRVRIYQDGLPLCGHEPQLVEELARAGSRNHQLVADLMKRGALLVGTEDPLLLIREYEMHRRGLGSPAGQGGGACDDEMAQLLQARDRFIASRIAETLQENEIGVVFLGAAHSLRGLLPADVFVETLMSRTAGASELNGGAPRNETG